MTLKERLLQRAKSHVSKKEYDLAILSLIRERYSADEENAILRKKLANIDNGEFDEFNAFVEECKAKVKMEYRVEE